MTRSVLVVDDADDLRGLVALILRSHGFEVREAASAAEARRGLAEQPADVVVTDVYLGSGGGSGLDLVREMRTSAAGCAARVVLLTASPDLDPALLAELDVAEVLAKPVTIDDVIGAVTTAPRV